MLKTTLALFILALAVTCASAAQDAGGGEAAEAERLNAEVLKLYREGKYDEALPAARRVLELREKALGGEDIRVAYALANLGNVHARKGEYKEAEPLFTRALALAERRGAAESDFAADLHKQLGLMRVDTGKYKEAEPYLQRVLEIREKLHGAEDARLVPALLNLTDLGFLRTQPEKAHAFLGRALSILKRGAYARDAATAKRLKYYYCPLVGSGSFSNRELSDQLSNVIWRLEEPESAAKYDKSQKEREERGEVEKKGDKKLVEGGVLNGRAISKPQPGYPPAAKNARVSGAVVVKILVDETGKVINAEAICGHPILAKESVEAALKARFTPTLLSGVPVKVSGIITYNFVLQ